MNQCTISDACKSLSPEEIKRMVNEAEAMKSNDADYAEKLDLKSKLEEAAYDLEEDEGERLMEWLQGRSLDSVSKSDLERKLASVQKKL